VSTPIGLQQTSQKMRNEVRYKTPFNALKNLRPAIFWFLFQKLRLMLSVVYFGHGFFSILERKVFIFNTKSAVFNFKKY
jgi:hypothetical protein